MVTIGAVYELFIPFHTQDACHMSQVGSHDLFCVAKVFCSLTLFNLGDWRPASILLFCRKNTDNFFL